MTSRGLDRIGKIEQVIRASGGPRAAVLRMANKLSRDTFTTRLRLYDIPFAGGRMPPDVTIYLAEIYRNGTDGDGDDEWYPKNSLAIETPINWMRNRSWQLPGPPQDILSIMGAADDSFMLSDPDIWNSIAFTNAIRCTFAKTAHEAQPMVMSWWDWEDDERPNRHGHGERWRRIIRLTMRLHGLCRSKPCSAVQASSETRFYRI
jgi:hypothetical protein